MARRNGPYLDGPLLAHYQAFCRAFLLPRYAERKLLRPRELFEDFCHDIPCMLKPHVALPLPPRRRDDQVTALVHAATSAPTAAWFGAWSGAQVGMFPTPAAIEQTLAYPGSAASIEPGQLALLITEGTPGDAYLLVADEHRRRRIAAQVATHLAGHHEP